MDSRSLYPKSDNQIPQSAPRLAAPVRAVPWQTIISWMVAAAGLGWGVWLRVAFFRSFPDPFPTPDTWSYLTGAYGLLEKGQFELFSMRTPGFPLLVWLILFIFKSFAALSVAHGALTLLSALAIAFAVRAFGGPWRVPAALAAGFLAVHPHLLFWEHFALTEGSFQAFFVLALVATALAILRPTPVRAAAAGVFTAFATLIRPQGIFLTPLVLLALVWASRRFERRQFLRIVAATALGPLLLLGGWSARNAAVHGFFGLSNIGPVTSFSVAARWIELESPRLAEDKALIADSIRRYRSMPEDFNWVAWSPEGPAAILSRKYGNDIVRRDKVFNALAREAILHHPVGFLRRGIDATYVLMAGTMYYGGLNFVSTASQYQDWNSLIRYFPVNKHLAVLDETRFPIAERRLIFDEEVSPALAWVAPFIWTSRAVTLLAILALPLLRGPRRMATAVAAVSVVLLILTAGFFTVLDERYLSVIHGGAALAGGLAVTGLFERWMPLVK